MLTFGVATIGTHRVLDHAVVRKHMQRLLRTPAKIDYLIVWILRKSRGGSMCAFAQTSIANALETGLKFLLLKCAEAGERNE